MIEFRSVSMYFSCKDMEPTDIRNKNIFALSPHFLISYAN